MSDALAQVARRLDEEDEAKTYQGRTSWSKRAVDVTVAELSDDDRVALVCRKAAGVLEGAQMSYTAQLLRLAARSIEVGLNRGRSDREGGVPRTTVPGTGARTEIFSKGGGDEEVPNYRLSLGTGRYPQATGLCLHARVIAESKYRPGAAQKSGVEKCSGGQARAFQASTNRFRPIPADQKGAHHAQIVHDL
jgi:hypothetical protein